MEVKYKDYCDIDKKYSGYISAGLNNLHNQKKKSPLVAGIVGQAIGGVGVGIYSAINTANRNNSIDIKNATKASNTVCIPFVPEEVSHKRKLEQTRLEYATKNLKRNICKVEEVNELIKNVENRRSMQKSNNFLVAILSIFAICAFILIMVFITNL